MLVLIGTAPEGKKGLPGSPVGMREGAQGWRELLADKTRPGRRARAGGRRLDARLLDGARCSNNTIGCCIGRTLLPADRRNRARL